MNPTLAPTPHTTHLVLEPQTPHKFDDLIQVARALATAHPLPLAAVADVATVTARIWLSRNEPQN
jgi:hypothetical protein